MKLAFPQDGAARGSGKKSGRSPKRLSLAHARTQLGQAVGNVLAGSLEALGERLLSGPQETAAHAEWRLREVVRSDRALSAAQPAQAAPSSKSAAKAVEAPPAETEDRAEATVANEPIRTRTMARLLGSQGYRKRALAIYEELVAKHPEDAALCLGRDALLSGL